MHDPPLRSPANGSSDVEHGSFAAASRNDESLQGLELLLAVVDCVLQVRDPAVVDICLRQMPVHFLEVGRRQQGADTEKVALERDQHFVDAWQGLDSASEAEDGVELVDVAIGFDTDIVFGNAAAAEESSVAGVAGFRVDLHRGENVIAGLRRGVTGDRGAVRSTTTERARVVGSVDCSCQFSTSGLSYSHF